MESAHQFSSRPACNNTADLLSLILRPALSVIPLNSEGRRTVIPREIFTGFSKFQGIVSVNDFSVPSWLQELLASSFQFPAKRLFYTDMIESI